MATHLTRRGGVYYLRRRIPQDLIDGFGKQEVVRSLHTKDRAEAERLLRRATVPTLAPRHFLFSNDSGAQTSA